MAALRAVFGKEVEVVARDVEGTRKLWRPDAHECALDIAKFKLRLDRSGLCQRKSVERRRHGARVNVREAAVDANGVKEVFRIAVLVAELGDLLEGRGIFNGLILIRGKVRHYRKRGSHVVA